MALIPPPGTWQPQDWVNRGGELLASDPALAQRLIGQGVRSLPEEGIAWFNLGLALHQRRRIPAAVRAYQQSLRCSSNPAASEATNNLAQDLLLLGRCREGWEHYERRFERTKADFSPYVQLCGQAWQGWHDPRPCDELLVVGEQGLGDTLQFARLLPLLQERGLRTRLFCQEPLGPLLRSGSAIGPVSLMLDGKSNGRVRWCPLLSLPHRLGLDWDNIPAAEGYLRAEPERVAQWQTRLQRKPGHQLIGLHWQGNPKFERSLYSRGRSMPFSAWQGLAGLGNVEFLSIQKGAAAVDVQQNNHLPFVAGQAAFDASFDFRDTAAALMNCDLLLSADSSVVHLAGALARPVWIALSWVPEWRWGLEGSSTPWYASARLFRQPHAGAWNQVVQAMREALLGEGFARL